MRNVLLGLSGGVDSAVAAHLLKQQGYNVTGAYLKMHDLSDDELKNAKIVADSLNIKLVTIDLREKFKSVIVLKFVSDYLSGKTPNPCILCNPLVKFNGLLEYANQNNIEYIATGHYAKISTQNSRFYVSKAKCLQKDQSYVLYRLGQDILSRLILVLGDIESKDKVRKIAAQNSLACASRSDSQEICFIDKGINYSEFIEQWTGKKMAAGLFVDNNGAVVGRHSGFVHYTVGQRRGLGQGFGQRVYVTDIDPYTNIVRLGLVEQLMKTSIELDDVIYNADEIPGLTNVSVKIRYRDSAQAAKFYYLGNNRAKVVFDKPKRAPAKGQSAVFYKDDLVVGGGFITNCK